MKSIMRLKSVGLAFLLAVLMMFSPLTILADGVTEVTQQKTEKNYTSIVDQAIDDASTHMINEGVNSEWQAIGLARAGKEIPADYIEQFNQNIEKQITQGLQKGRIKITDIERLAMAALAIGKDPFDVDGHNLIELIYNSPDDINGSDIMTLQGNNGPVFALIALDTGSFEIPNNARWTRGKLIEYLLEEQNGDGSWALFGTAPSYDMTGMAMIALGKYVEKPEVKKSIEKAVSFLSNSQNDDAGFEDPWNGGVSVESAAQIMIGLTTAGIDPLGPEFTKENGNLLDHILSFMAEDGGFKHLPGDNISNNMATEQALQALVAYQLYENGEGRLYEFSGIDTDTKLDIKVDGIIDGKTYQNEQITFTVKLIKSTDKEINPVVKLNDDILEPENKEEYTAKLNEGKNTITITAVDETDNLVKKSFVINYQPVKEVIETENGKQVTIDKASKVIVKNSNTSIKLPKGLPSGTKLTTKIFDENYSQYEGLQTAGDIVDFKLEYPINSSKFTGSYRLSMGVNEEVDIAKTGIYHFDEAANQWKYVGGFGSAKNGLITIDVDHFSTYGVFTDTTGPSDVQVTKEKVTSNKITLGLSAYDPSGVKEYIIYRDGKEIAVVSGDQLEFIDTGLEPEKTYKYTVIAIDKLGNESTEINVSITTAKTEKQDEKTESTVVDTNNKDEDHKDHSGHKLPNTATSTFNLLLIGFVFIFVGCGIYFIRKKATIRG